MTELNYYTYNSSADPDEFFDSDRFSVGDFLTGNGYSPDRDDFGLIHSKYNLNYNGLFDIPIYIARVHSDDGTFNHGISAIFTGDNLNDLEDWLFLEPQSGEVREPGSWSVPFNSRVDILGVHDFKSAYNFGVIDLPKTTVAAYIHIDSQGNREMTYINPNMIEDQTSLAVEDNENTNISDSYLLKPNFPNPFNSSTTIQFDIPLNPPSKGDSNVKTGHALSLQVIIYDITGKEILTLANNINTSGSYKVEWNASGYPSGIYFYTLRTKDFTKTRKMLLLR